MKNLNKLWACSSKFIKNYRLFTQASLLNYLSPTVRVAFDLQRQGVHISQGRFISCASWRQGSVNFLPASTASPETSTQNSEVKVAQSCATLCKPMDYPGQNTGVSSLSFLQGDLPKSGIKPRSPTLQADSLPAESQGKPLLKVIYAIGPYLGASQHKPQYFVF